MAKPHPVYKMPKCPECGHTEESSGEWVDTYTEENNLFAGLVICPSCDCVLGGMATEIGW